MIINTFGEIVQKISPFCDVIIIEKHLLVLILVFLRTISHVILIIIYTIYFCRRVITVNNNILEVNPEGVKLE